MKALSIRQPWAWMVVMGYKDIENRSWSTDYRGRIYVHASKVFDYDGFNWICYHAFDLPPFDAAELATLAVYWKQAMIIGEVDIVGCVTENSSPWFVGPYGFVLAKPVAYQMPFPFRGRRGFFELEEGRREIQSSAHTR